MILSSLFTVALFLPTILGASLSSSQARSTKGGLKFNRAKCQAPTKDPLQGCPKGTLLVGPSNKYTTIQSAVSALPNNTSPAVILVLPGTYTEQVNVTRPGPLYLLGQTKKTSSQGNNTVTVLWRAVAGTGDNAYTSVLTVAPNLNASLTGSGPTGFPVLETNPFGNVDFRAYNIDFVNDFAPYSNGPSLTVSMGYANAGFYHCGFYSYQDTIYVGKLGNAYFSKCTIAGQTDFLYGFGTAWIQSSDLLMRSCGGGITAWKGTNTTFENKYGVYIHDGNVKKANSSLNIVGKCALGRPWNAQHRSIFANNYLDDSIRPDGYIKWSETDNRITNLTMQAEYKDYGPGFNLTARIAAYPVTRELSRKEYEPYSRPERVFQDRYGKFGNTGWIDFSV